jgi:hypothetical protein
MRVLNLASIVATASSALATTASPAHADRDGRTHMELTWGFVGGQRSYAHQAFAFKEGDVSPALAEPFLGEPFDGVPVLGMGFEVRLVTRGIRTALGYEYPYPRIDPPIMLATAGGPPAQVRALETSELRLSMGYEYAWEPAVVYADLVGTAYEAKAKVVVGDAQSTYDTSGFSFAARVGARLAINKNYFAYAHGEAGLTGHILWAAHGGLGVNVP